MSLRPQSVLPPVPEDTARIARTAFRRGNPYLLLRDHSVPSSPTQPLPISIRHVASPPTRPGVWPWSR